MTARPILIEVVARRRPLVAQQRQDRPAVGHHRQVLLALPDVVFRAVGVEIVGAKAVEIRLGVIGQGGEVQACLCSLIEETRARSVDVVGAARVWPLAAIVGPGRVGVQVAPGPVQVLQSRLVQVQRDTPRRAGHTASRKRAAKQQAADEPVERRGR